MLADGEPPSIFRFRGVDRLLALYPSREAALAGLGRFSLAFLLADAAFNVTIVSLLIWVVFFPVLVQGLIIYAVVLARGEKRANDEYRHRHEG